MRKVTNLLVVGVGVNPNAVKYLHHVFAEILTKNETRGFDSAIELNVSEVKLDCVIKTKERIDAKKEMLGVYPRLILLKLLTFLSKNEENDANLS